MIEFQNVCAGYDGAPVLHDVSFSINKGDFVAFVGTNGAGKSTTMRLANGLLKPTSGRVLVDGVPTTELKTSQIARRVGFLFQNPDRQICCNTVREELLFGFVAQGRAGAQADSAVDAMCQRFGFDPAAEPFLLNRGARQLLALASIIVTEPDVVILDEPTTGLDFRECTAVMDVILAMNRAGTTVIMVCHDMEIVADYATRVIAMTAGRVVADGPCAQILRSADVAAEAHLEAPQVVQISTQLMQRQAHLRQTKIADANTVDELVRAIAEVRQNG